LGIANKKLVTKMYVTVLETEWRIERCLWY